MKVMTILGTRPEIIRLSLIIRKLDCLSSRHILVHTGQNYDRYLNDVFFEQMDVRKPDYSIQNVGHTLGQQIGQMFVEVEKLLVKEKPERILVLGDTNSALCAVLGERMGIPVYHMEAGNRCYDSSVPEEINRKMIDSISSFNLPYTPGSKENLLREGIPPYRIWVSGNPIYEVLQHYQSPMDQSDILQKMKLERGKYILVTAHRAENVDNESRLRTIVDGLHAIAAEQQMPLICSVHPRTQARLEQYGITIRNPLIILSKPFGFFDFIHLQKYARCVVTDSGTVQEESCLLGIPAVTIRKSTERPETVICGSNIVSGLDARRMAECVKLMIHAGHSWTCPDGYRDPNVSTKVVNMILGGVSHV
ncbi:UDP-N-acetylglucosamine 2-epimerase (non-hydrolyzing) [Fodinisporobacter ferrooxydans]|uniref:UDP-N-acetylglucosamine 2-epimerase (Non-hydrolyzing) n=1 Tax=Fodinisporobacter ferrooxydans TaxID=2901836 RepID=A0ABY4CJ50_9BACL|nr:UDP-N-acetylglucosamine 2-epimerase (non-hydrolyzing) [Alicyclobacillaceae bacterium MYW30-H2]